MPPPTVKPMSAPTSQAPVPTKVARAHVIPNVQNNSSTLTLMCQTVASGALFMCV